MVFRLAYSIVLGGEYFSATCPCSETDITTVFGTVVPGSSPGGGTR